VLLLNDLRLCGVTVIAFHLALFIQQSKHVAYLFRKGSFIPAVIILALTVTNCHFQQLLDEPLFSKFVAENSVLQ
jgi:hypothetical protein